MTLLVGACTRSQRPAASAGAPTFEAGPYIVQTAPGRVLVAFDAALTGPPVVEWWTATGRRFIDLPEGTEPQSVRASSSRGRWIAELEALPLGRWTVYRIRSGSRVTDPVAFRAGFPRGERFTFGVLGNTARVGKEACGVIEALSEEHIDFVVHTGNVAGSERIAKWDEFFTRAAPLLRHAPLLAAASDDDASPRDLFERAMLTTRWASSLSYFWQDWGDVRIVAVDTNLDLRPNTAQARVVEQMLADGARRGMLLVLVAHHPPYSSGPGGSLEHVRSSVHRIAVRYGVELVLSGHHHQYERTKKIDGVTYVVTGSGDCRTNPVHAQSFTSKIAADPHYVLVDAVVGALTVRAISVRGEAFDEAVLQPLAAGGPL